MGLLKKINFTLVIAMTYCAATAQDTPFFTVTPGNKVCLGQSITVNDFSSGGNGDVTYFFGDGTFTTPPDPNPTHTYTSANTFNLRQELPISGTVIDPSTGLPVGYVSYTVPIRVVPTTPLTATYTVCGNGRVNLKIVDDRFDSYDIDFGDGSGITNTTADPSGTTIAVHIYPTTLPIPNYNVTIKGKFASSSCAAANSLPISVTPIAAVPKPDVLFLETTTEDPTNGVITVQLINNTDFDYAWDFKRNGFSYTSNLGTIAHNSGSTALVLNKTNTNPYDPTTQAALHASYTVNSKNNSYCVRLATTTACGREALSDEICSISKFVGTAADLENDLTWDAYAGPNPGSIDVIRNNVVLTSLGGTASAYNDNAVVCANLYEYRVRENLSTYSSLGIPQYSLSAKRQITATSLTPRPALTNIFSTINGNTITVSFDPPTGGFTAQSYTLEESVNNGSYNTIATNPGTPTSFTLIGKAPAENTYCYKVNYVDVCNLSPSSAPETCPIKINVGLAEDGSVAVAWTPYSPNVPVVNYTVEVRDENGTVLRSIPAGSSLNTTDLLTSTAGQLYYIIIADNTSTSALVELQLSPAVYVPDAFSPNGDSVNDFFELKGRFIKSIDLAIFNRWGEPVFHSTDMKDQWDGRVNGGDAAIGTYAYTLEVTGQKGEVIKHKGTITLVR